MKLNWNMVRIRRVPKITVLLVCMSLFLVTLNYDQLKYSRSFFTNISRSRFWKTDNQSTSAAISKTVGRWFSIGQTTDQRIASRKEFVLPMNKSAVERLLRMRIGILVQLRAREYKTDNLESIPFLTKTLPSLTKTMETMYDYTIYTCMEASNFTRIKGEAFVKYLVKRFSRLQVDQCASRVPINELALRAYENGMDYLVLITDQTEILSNNWTSAAIRQLKNHNPSNTGLARAVSQKTGMAINSNFMFYRSHMNIFGDFCPAARDSVLSVDQWLSEVYRGGRISAVKPWVINHNQVNTNITTSRENKIVLSKLETDYYRSRVNFHVLNSLHEVNTPVPDESEFRVAKVSYSSLGVVAVLAPARNGRRLNGGPSDFCLLLNTIRSIDMFLNAALRKSYAIFVFIAADPLADPSGSDAEFTADDRQIVRRAAPHSNIRFIDINMYTKEGADPENAWHQSVKRSKVNNEGSSRVQARAHSERRLWCGQLQQILRLHKFKYYMRVDFTGYLTQSLKIDPFEEMEKSSANYSYVLEVNQTQNGSVVPDTSFHLARTEIFTSDRWRSYYRAIVRNNAFDNYETTVEKVHSVLLKFFISRNSVRNFDWVPYRHYDKDITAGALEQIDKECQVLDMNSVTRFPGKQSRCIKIVIGIFTTEKMQLRRENWRKLLNIGSSLTSLSCGVNFVSVVTGEKTNVSGALGLQSLHVLNKDLEWFKRALDTYKDADYIGKADSDTQLCPSSLHTYIMQSNTSAYFGQQACLETDPSTHHCPPFIYYHGGLYVLSSMAAQEVVYQYSFIKQPVTGSDEMTVGYLVNHLLGTRNLYYDLNSGSYPVFIPNKGDDASVGFPPGCENFTYISNVPRMVWSFWFGRPMQGKRLEAWESLKANIGVPVTLVTDENLHKYNVSSHPMHPALSLKRGLSMIHKGDYLRVYFMHHFGGGYHDVKPHKVSWSSSFDLFKDPEVWVLGIPEGGPGDVGCISDYVHESPACLEIKAAKNGTSCCKLVADSWKSLVSNGAYILRPKTNLTFDWLTNIERHLTAKYNQIKAHPAPKPRCCQEGEPYYPIGWTELHGSAFHPVQYRYATHVRKGLPRWEGGAYSDAQSESTTYR